MEQGCSGGRLDRRPRAYLVAGIMAAFSYVPCNDWTLEGGFQNKVVFFPGPKISNGSWLSGNVLN